MIKVKKCIKALLIFWIGTLSFVLNLNAQEVDVFMDLQIHPSMHIPYGFFGEGFTYFDSLKAPKLNYKHTLTNVNYANYLENNSGARVIVSGALVHEYKGNEDKAREIILTQLKFINDFADSNAMNFVVAKSPQEARHWIHNSEKTVILHSIEGGRGLINSQVDADFWAAQGVSFITLIHLRDSDLGTAAIKPEFVTRLINLKGTLKRDSKRGGLTAKGKQVIVWLAKAGVMTDITHMSDASRADALEVMKKHHIPPISTHDGYKSIQNHPRGISSSDVLKIYQENGFVSLPISGVSLKVHKPSLEMQQKLDSMDCYCDGSIDSYKFTYNEVKLFLEENCDSILGKSFQSLTEKEKVNLAIGFQSDFNGWLNHSKPRYGKDGCYKLVKDSTYSALETKGLAHPGMMPAYWEQLESESVDLAPIKRSSEKFLQLWEYFLSQKGRF